ncbi:MAG TPA: hypothetical protein VHK27_04905, partial [Gammaproteobacteria bacterium]|nr:hypothetical protein [Gammaproteobacteria bacterium]
GRLTVQDTESINLTLTGNGSASTPWVLRADTALELGDLTDVDTSNTTVGYVLGRNAGGDFEMMPPAVAPPGSVFADQETIEGDGTVGNPFRVYEYQYLAKLDGADPNNLPNAADLTLGDPTDDTVYRFRTVRAAQPGYPFTSADASMRLYATGDGYGPTLELHEDGMEQSRFTLRRDGTLTVTVDGFTHSLPFRQVTGAGTIPITNSSNGTLIVPFTPGLFTQIPRIFVTINETGSTTAAEQEFIVLADNKSTGGFRAVARHTGGAIFANSNIQFVWHAIQQSAL